MKKLLSISLLLFSLSLFVSCSSDDDNNDNGGGTTTFDNWNDPKSPNYKPNGYNPLFGEWVKYDKMITLVFTNDFKFKTIDWINGKWGTPKTVANYMLNDKAFKLDQPYADRTEFNYTIVVDTLSVYYGTDKPIKYYRSK